MTLTKRNQAPPQKGKSENKQEKTKKTPEKKIVLGTEYQKMMDAFQQGNWKECSSILQSLEKAFPENEKVKEFRTDFDLKYSIYNNAISKKKGKKINTPRLTKPGLKMFGIVSGAVILLGLLIYGSFQLIQYRTAQEKNAQIQSLGAQAESLLNSSQPEKAKAIIDVMKNIDPNNELILSLTQKTNKLLAINDQYQIAKEYLASGDYNSALPILQEINKSAPNYKDVSSLLEGAQNKIDEAKALSEGTAAFENNQWQRAIDDFEKVQNLDPNYADQTFKDMLLNSYLHRIIQLLENSSSSLSDITRAETYYRHAIAMVPQNKSYQAERENLQKASRDLLELKFAQAAYTMVSDPSQTINSINDALGYLKKAANLDPSNAALQTEVNKMTLYQAGLQYYIQQNWFSAIQQLQALSALDDAYAGGLAKQLLFESYIGRGSQDYNVGFYGDARLQFEAAEALVWDEKNSANLYIARVELARTLGKMTLFKDANDYFVYALDSINYLQFNATATDAVNKIAEAKNFNAIGQYELAYNEFTDVLSAVPFYFETKVRANQGQCLAMIAAQYHSTAQLIIMLNNLTQQTTLENDQELLIPTFSQ